MKPTLTQARLMQGDEACAEGALAAGCTFFAGYPITPATEIAEVRLGASSSRWRTRSPRWPRFWGLL
jgi:TPP-dependent indolepyruvate ferredoxin oxidoreductase alpha subunit